MPTPALRVPRRSSVAFRVTYGVTVLLLFEAFFRVYLRVAWGVPLLHPSSIAGRLYPELKLVDPYRADSGPNILLLGGSVLQPAMSRLPERLAARLAPVLGDRFRIFDLAESAQTTRDTLFKYQALAGRHFDLVVVYHAINDLRANNCPPEMFDDRYAHYSAYETLAVFERHRSLIDVTVTPYVLDLLYHRLKQSLFPFHYLQRDFPGADLMRFGGDIKTARPFEANLTALLDAAGRRREPVLLMTFASYVPPGYTRQAFEAKKLDYVKHLYPIELWGLPENVEKGLEVHNAVIRKLAGEGRPGVFLLDMERTIPKQGKYFDDICHLSEEGYERFADALASEILCIGAARRASPGRP